MLNDVRERVKIMTKIKCLQINKKTTIKKNQMEISISEKHNI